MSAQRRSEQKRDQILALAAEYARERWGATPQYIIYVFPNGSEQRELVPPHAVAQARLFVAADPNDDQVPYTQVRAEVGPPWHNDEYTVVRWPGLGEFRFGAKQALVVKELWSARFGEDGDPDRDAAALLEVAGSDCPRLADLFGRSTAWGTLIVKGSQRGSYRLPDPPVDEGEESE